MSLLLISVTRRKTRFRGRSIKLDKTPALSRHRQATRKGQSITLLKGSLFLLKLGKGLATLLKAVSRASRELGWTGLTTRWPFLPCNRILSSGRAKLPGTASFQLRLSVRREIRYGPGTKNFSSPIVTDVPWPSSMRSSVRAWCRENANCSTQIPSRPFPSCPPHKQPTASELPPPIEPDQCTSPVTLRTLITFHSNYTDPK